MSDRLSDRRSFTLPGLLYGGDYNPEQWPETVWHEDVRLMAEAGVNCVSLAIFSWATIEPAPGRYDFDTLERVIELLHANGIYVLLATATASPPPWFSRLHPESLPIDKQGLRYKPGSRQHYCPNSTAYRQASAALAGAIARRYKDHPAVLMWHVNNEYACHISECYCDVCRDSFRSWLHGCYPSLDALNEAWGTHFWSQHYTDWDEIELPHRTTTFRNPGQVLDFRRFMNASILALFQSEVHAIRAAGAQQPLFTNMVYGLTALDQFQWGHYADYTAVDIYPDPAQNDRAYRTVAFAYDLTRAAGGGDPFLLVEQATTQVNWRGVNALKPPGMMRALSYQALARGADSVMFFQWRASQSGAEKYHSAIVPHNGTENSRIFREVSALGAELRHLADIVGSRVQSQVGVLFSYENVWALEIDSKPAQIAAMDAILPWHDALVAQNFAVDFIHPDANLSNYRVLVAPLLYLITPSQADRLRAFVRDGGTLVMTYFSGIVDAHDRVGLGGYPTLLRDVLGVTVEEWMPLQSGEKVHMLTAEHEPVHAEHWIDLMHTHGAEVLAQFSGGWIDGRPAITRHAFGSGHAYTIATRPMANHLRTLLRSICATSGVTPLVDADEGVEASLRLGETMRFLFIINHTAEPKQVRALIHYGRDRLGGAMVTTPFTLEPYGVRVIERA